MKTARILELCLTSLTRNSCVYIYYFRPYNSELPHFNNVLLFINANYTQLTYFYTL